MIGKDLNAECEMRNAKSRLRSSDGKFNFILHRLASFSGKIVRNPRSAIRNQSGFSLLELLIAMFILIILLSIALPAYQSTVQHARETVLKENLWQIRRSIDQYAADKGKLPQSIDDLVEEEYLREKPIDPITQKAEWEEISGEDIYSTDGGQGLKDVKSLAQGNDSNGEPYSKY